MSEGEVFIGAVAFGLWLIVVVVLYMGMYEKFKKLVLDIGIGSILIILLSSLLWFIVLPLSILAIVLQMVYRLGQFLSTKVNTK